MLKKHIFIDFDGVLIDSSYEAFLVFCLAKKINSTNNLFSTFEGIRAKITKAWQYNYIFLENNRLALKKPKEFPSINDLKFEKIFFKKRSELRIFKPMYWLLLHKKYRFTRDLIFLLSSNNRDKSIQILTHKDSESVEVIIRNLIPQLQNIPIVSLSDIGANLSKVDYLKSQSNLKNFLFIDDNEDIVRDISIEFPESKIFLADWGYNEKKTKFSISNNEMIKLLKSYIDEY